MDDLLDGDFGRSISYTAVQRYLHPSQPHLPLSLVMINSVSQATTLDQEILVNIPNLYYTARSRFLFNHEPLFLRISVQTTHRTHELNSHLLPNPRNKSCLSSPTPP
jgi:hypothetical protein